MEQGAEPEELKNRPKLPAAAKHVWEYFLELNSQRSENGFGGNPISYVEIQAWRVLKRIRLRPWEVDLITVIDLEFRRVQNSIQQSDRDSNV